MTPEIRLARRNGRKAIKTTSRGVTAFIELSELADNSGIRSRLRQADQEISKGVSGLIDASIALEPVILELTAPDMVSAMRARLARARKERDGEFLFEIVRVAC